MAVSPKHPKKQKGKETIRIEINPEWCKGCNICVAFCPKKVLVMDSQDKAAVLHPEECDGCGLCDRRCPDMAIEIIHE